MEGLQKLFETTNAQLFQCDSSERYVLHFSGNELIFQTCELITFKRKIQKWDIVPMLAPDAPDVDLLYLPHCDRIFAFTIHDFLELKELFAGAFAMLELNSVIHREIIRKAF